MYWSLVGSHADLDQMKDDVSLNVATGFLRAVLAEQQINIAKKQVDLSSAQMQQTLAFVKAGRLPEVNAAQLQSQVATDSAALISAQADYTTALLDLKALLNLDFETPLRPVAPDLSSMDAINFSLPEPAAVYAEATKHFGAVRSSRLRLEASQKNAYSARAARLPQLSVGGQLGTNYASNFQTLTGVTTGPATETQYFVRGSDSLTVPVYQYGYNPTFGNIPFTEQFQNNFRNTLSVNLTLPIFNNWQSQYNLRRAVAQAELDRIGQTTSEVTLRQNVYKAHNDARTAIQKWIAADRAATAARRAFELGQKRYELGLSNTVEYLSIQNNQYAAESQALQAKYDLVFRLKVIDYYLGRPLTL
jgi:outer membrane protein